MSDAELRAEIEYQFKKTRQFLLSATTILMATMLFSVALIVLNTDPTSSLVAVFVAIVYMLIALATAGDGIVRQAFNRLPFGGEISDPQREKPHAVDRMGQEVSDD